MDQTTQCTKGDNVVALRDALEAVSEGVAVFDCDNVLVTCNQQYVDMFPRIAELIVPGTPWDDILSACLDKGEFVDPFGDKQAFLNRASIHRVNFERDVIAEHFDGRTYLVRFKPALDGGCIVTRSDVSEQHTTDAIVHDRETLLATVLDTSPVAIVLSQLDDGKIIYRSQEARSIFGETTHAFQHHPTRKGYLGYIETLHENSASQPSNVLCRRFDGTEFEASAAGRIVEFTGRACVVSAYTDLSEEMERDALIRQVLQACPAPIRMLDLQTGETLFSSPETTALFGEAKPPEEYYVNKRDREKFLAEIHKYGLVKEFKAQFYNRDGLAIWCAVSARLIRFNGHPTIVTHSRDLTEELKVEAQLTTQREAIYQNEKMSALGELLAGVAHELNNPLSVVVGHSLMLREDTQDADMLRQVDKISGAAERCAKIVKTFLSMARQQPSKMEVTDINEIVRIAVDVARYGDLGNTLEIDYELADDLPRCEADSDQITQVVLNLLLNAAQAIQITETGDTVTVRTRASRNGQSAFIEVEDNGPGIPVAQHSRIFEPFFTTKDVGEGTGIGLTICHRIIMSHKGAITIDKSKKVGARFSIALPALTQAQLEAAGKPIEARPTDLPARILIVDDEADVADLNAEILTRAGYAVDVVNEAALGLEMLAQAEYNLILSDLNMPEVDGRGFFDAIKSDFPALVTRIGFVTGDTMGTASQSFLKEAQRPFLEKPVSPRELRSFVADILNNVGAQA